MVAVEFDALKFSEESIQRWMAEKSVDGTLQEQQNPLECYVVRRSEIAENEETRRMVLEDGVTAVIARSDVYGIPEGYAAVVNESAYGSWGWGQLDFAAAMADREFSEGMEKSLYRLNDVLQVIILHSSLPLDVRKNLANRALAQFGEYVGTLMDSLPRQLLVSVVRSANPQQEKELTKQVSGEATPEANAQPVEAKTVVEAPLSRADVATMITEAVAAALAAKPAATETEAQRAAPAAVAAPAAQVVELALSRADIAAAVAEALAPVMKEVTELKGATLLRSAPEATPTPAAPKTKGEQENEVFRNAFSFPTHPRKK